MHGYEKTRTRKARRVTKRKKSKNTSVTRDAHVTAIVAHKLVLYMNAYFPAEGSTVYTVTESILDDAVSPFVGIEPSFSSDKVDDEDRSLFMTFDYQRLPSKSVVPRLDTALPKYRDIPDFALPYLFEASIRLNSSDRRVLNYDGRFSDRLIPALKVSTKPASSLLNRVRDAAKRIAGISIEQYLVLETKDRRKGDLPHVHGTISFPSDTTDEQIHAIFRAAFGAFHGRKQVVLNEPYPKRAGYLGKQVKHTRANMRKQGFVGDQFVAASDKIRSGARELWDDHIHYSNRDRVVSWLETESGPIKVVKDLKLRSRLLDIEVNEVRGYLKKGVRPPPDRGAIMSDLYDHLSRPKLPKDTYEKLRKPK